MQRKTVLITGAARGIGYAAATLFAEAGYAVALLDRDEEALAEATPQGDILKLPLDVSAPDTGPKAVAAILDRWGRLDALINNAGVADFRPIAETDLATWRRVMETNLDGVFLMTQAARPALAKTGGAIVNIASISGLRASTLRSAYGTSKAAVIQLTRQQAAELGEDGIRVNCVAPGPVDTKLALAVHSPEIRAAYHDAIPLNRYGTEAEIAAPVVFLCSDAASYITGQTLAVDGGFEATGVGLPALRES